MKKIKYFDEWVLFWLDVYKKRTVKPSTYESYLIAAKHIQCHVKLKRLKPEHLQGIINNMIDLGLAQSTIKHTVTLMKQAVCFAHQRGLCHGMDFSLLNVTSHQTKRRIVSLNPEEQIRFMSHLQDTFYGDLYSFLLLTGLRVGEALALTWDDVDARSRSIHINKTLYRGQIQSPKSKSAYRDIPLTDDIFLVLRRQYTAIRGIIWRNTIGTAISYRSLLDCFKRYCELCGIGSYGLHSLRHTYATNALTAGVNPKVLSELLGHASISVTLGIYTDVRSDHKYQASEQIADYMQSLISERNRTANRIINFAEQGAV